MEIVQKYRITIIIIFIALFLSIFYFSIFSCSTNSSNIKKIDNNKNEEYLDKENDLNYSDDDNFELLIEEIGLIYNLPKNYEYILKVVQKEPGVFYHRGLKHLVLDLEVRLLLLPNSFISASKNVEQFFYNFSCSIIANITHNPTCIHDKSFITYFPKEAAKTEFGADFGLTTSSMGESDFMKGYKWVQVNAFLKIGK